MQHRLPAAIVFVILLCLAFVPTSAIAQATYTWRVVSGNVATAASWSPNRTTPLSNDILVVNGASAATSVPVTMNTTTTLVGKLQLINAAVVNLNATATGAKTLTLGGGANALLVTSGSALKLTGSPGLTVALLAGSTGQIDGDVVITSTGAGTQHRLQSNTVDGIQFTSGSTCAMAPGNNNGGGGFDTAGIANGVRFLAGSTHNIGGLKDGTRSAFSGSTPFGMTAPASVVTFDPDSTVVVWDFDSSLNSLLSARTFGHLHWRGSANQSGGGTQTCLVQGDLFVRPSLAATTGTLGYTGTAAGTALAVRGRFAVLANSGGFNDNGAPTSSSAVEFGGSISTVGNLFDYTNNRNRVYVFNGTAAQSIDLPSRNISNVTFANRAAGVTVTNNMTVSSTLTLSTGTLVRMQSNTLTLGISTSSTGNLVVEAGTPAPRINGTFRRWVDTTSVSPYQFPIGRAANTRAATVTFTAPPAVGGTLTADEATTDPGTLGFPLDDAGQALDQATSESIWTIAAANGLSGGQYNLDLDVSAFSDHGTTSALRIVKRDLAGPWTLNGTAGINAPAIIRRSAMTNFSDFAIAIPPTVASRIRDWIEY